MPSLLLSRRAPAPSGPGSSLLGNVGGLRALADSIPANVMVADLDFTLVYMNRRAKETLTSLSGEIRRLFKIDVNQLVGASIHSYGSGKTNVGRKFAAIVESDGS